MASPQSLLRSRIPTRIKPSCSRGNDPVWSVTLRPLFGVHNLALAEDVVQEAFCRATEVWPYRGVPENPSAWLMATAKNCALDVLRRERTALTFAPELGRLLESEWTLAPVIEEAFGPNAIKDDLLRMMFSCLSPAPGSRSAGCSHAPNPLRLQRG